MNTNLLREKISQMRQSFFDEGILDQQFENLEQIEPENPNFLQEIMKFYSEESMDTMECVEDELQRRHPDFDMMEKILYQFMRKSASVGALQVKNAVNEMRRCLGEGDYEICTAAIASVKETQEDMHSRLEIYFQMKKQLQEAEKAEQQGTDDEDEESDDDES